MLVLHTPPDLPPGRSTNTVRPIKIELYKVQEQSTFIDPRYPTPVTSWRWTARRGGRIIAASTEAYGERIAAVDNIALVFGIPLRRLVKPGARTINVNWERFDTAGTTPWVLIEVKTR